MVTPCTDMKLSIPKEPDIWLATCLRLEVAITCQSKKQFVALHTQKLKGIYVKISATIMNNYYINITKILYMYSTKA